LPISLRADLAAKRRKRRKRRKKSLLCFLCFIVAGWATKGTSSRCARRLCPGRSQSRNPPDTDKGVAARWRLLQRIQHTPPSPPPRAPRSCAPENVLDTLRTSCGFARRRLSSSPFALDMVGRLPTLLPPPGWGIPYQAYNHLKMLGLRNTSTGLELD